MGRRRFAPLIVVVVLGALVLMARLFTIQVLEREIWTAQADALVRDGTVEPYTRGEIVDCRGRVLARDVESYRIDANYRDFRRGNALGVIAHARSTLEMRPVALAETREHLESWAIALARLSPRDLEKFSRGAGLECAGVRIAPTPTPERDARAGRAVDLSFYATALFDLQPAERSRLKKLKSEQRTLAFAEWLAQERKSTQEQVEAALAARCRNDRQFLDDFAELWPSEHRLPGQTPLAQVLVELERWRSEVEDGAAGDLFEAAAGFPAGRIEPDCLSEYFDLDWIRRCLRWDEARLAAWTRAARSTWLELRDGQVLDFAVERARRDVERVQAVELVLREVVPLFVQPERDRREVFAAEQGWFGRGPTQVLGELGSLFSADLPGRLSADARLPIFDPVFAEQVAQAPEDAGVLARMEFWRSDGAPGEPALLESAAGAWRARFDGRFDRAELRRGIGSLFLRMEEAFQSEVRERLSQAREHARLEGDLDERGKLPMADARLDRAEERVRYILKDRGSRHFAAVSRPSYPLVNLLTRYPRYLRGFEVTRVHSRVNPTRDAADRPVARLLVGRLAPPSVSRRLTQAEIEREIALLESRGGRDEACEAMLAELRASLDRPDEEVGAFGLERLFEPELAGRNGFREERGLAESEAGGRARAGIARVDGLSLVTTLDAALQQEAEDCLAHPEGDPLNPDKNDTTWLDNPTGAIVLLTPDGDVIVAASWPLVERPFRPGRSPISDDVRERSLSKPDFQPPGSVFKPFVAAYALDHLALAPGMLRECSAAMNPGGRGPGYGGVHCHETSYGHGAVDLHRALTVSCNSYFAWLGEQYDGESLAAMAHEFGFGEPTGVRSFANSTRGGLHEDVVAGLFRDRVLKGRSLCEAGNGLSVVEATPMQVARATAGLASGVLPQLRLVSRIGERDLLREARPLGISKPALDAVRAAMLAVTRSSEGSAHTALSESQLGFSMAAKTGSADLTSSAVEEQRVLKHTWVAGWFPAENPVGILVVFEHRTTRSSVHTAIWLARQFLKRPAVSAWIAERIASR